MNIAFTTHYYDKKVIQADLSWEDICELLSEHILTEDKYSVPMFCPALFKSITDKDCILVDDEAISKVHENVLEYSCIPFDYDKITYDQMTAVLNFFEHYKYLIYSSYSNQKSDIDTYSFRILLPLSSPIGVDTYFNMKTEFLQIFPHVDSDASTFSRARFFSLPSTPNNTNTFFSTNDGELFEWQQIEPFTLERMQEEAEAREPESAAPVYSNQDQDDEIYKLQNALTKISGDNYSDWFRVACALKHQSLVWGDELCYQLLDTWSRSHPNYDAAKNRKTWNGIRTNFGGKATTIGSIYYMASK